MNKYFLILCVCFSFLSHLQAQNIDTYLKEIAKERGTDIRWQERKTSFATEGIRSFVGYHNGDFVATLSVSNKEVSGSLERKGTHYEVSAQKGRLVFRKSETGSCANESAPTSYWQPAHARPAAIAAEEEQPAIANTQVLRIYRLAVTISYNCFKKTDLFDHKVEKVKAYWADVENYLNAAYERDLGIHFELINDERLILKTQAEEKFDPTLKSGALRYTNNLFLKELLGDKNFEAGICISYFNSPGIKGEAQTEGVYMDFKGEAVAYPTKDIVAHEVGHLFGGQHTYSAPLSDGDKTEYGRGESIMSMGFPRDFFSLSSIHLIRKKLTQTPYYSDKERTKVVGNASYPNIPYGIPFNTKAPVIDKAKIKAEYIIPEDTFFQFYIPATDEDSDQLLYAANQHDARPSTADVSITQYLTYKASTANPVVFKREYSEKTGNKIANSWDDSNNGGVRHETGTFTFWLAVSDAQPGNTDGYVPQYDLVQTKVTVKEGTPFKITTTPKKKYKGKSPLTLQWDVDNAIFSNTKVRILLSDDLGHTFKHILIAETNNDGSEEITLPNISTTKAVLKVEVIDGLAFDLTNYNPKGGGFTIEKDKNLPSEPLTWANLPTNLTVDCAKAVPAVVTPTTQGGCATVTITFTEKEVNKVCPNRFSLERTFTATDGCTTLTHTQLIKVEDNTPPSFVGSLPQDITIEEGSPTPTLSVLTATDSCGTASVSSSVREVKTNGKITQLIYQWEAKDSCGNTTTHTQTISITPKPVMPPLVWATLPTNLTVDCAKAVPAVVTPTTQGGCATVTITFAEKEVNKVCPNRFSLERTFTATDGYTTLTHTQLIKVEDNTPPSFVGSLPQDITIEEGSPTPTLSVLTATDSCGTASVSSSVREVKTNGKITQLIYQWEAKDSCGNTTTHTQTISITPKPVMPPLVWATLPNNTTVDCAKAVPAVVTPTTQGGCATVTITFAENKVNKVCANRFSLERTFTATDGCTTLTHTQLIKVEDNTPPSFVGSLPQNITIEEGEAIPLQQSISAEDSCAGNPITVTRTQKEERTADGKLSKVVYMWVARDACGNERTHTQTITITPKAVVPQPPTPPTPPTPPVVPPTPPTPPAKEVVIYNAVSTENGSDNYFKIENTDEGKHITLLIFDEMGLKVYENNQYGEKGDYFRGYANAQGVINRNKRLAGTYFYIVTYYINGKQEVKKGFLYVK